MTYNVFGGTLRLAQSINQSLTAVLIGRRQKLESVGAETCLGSPFQIQGPETLKVPLPTVDRQSVVSHW